MHKRALIICLFIVVFISLAAQQGEYQRKSISSVESVWLSGTARQAGDFNYVFFNKMIDLYIKVPRFDYNVLPESSLKDFRAKANALNVINQNTIGKVLEETVGKEIKRVLSDPEIQKARSGDLRTESSRIQLAQVKGREYGMTEEMIMILMNSAYIYLPYITTIERTYDKSIYTYKIEGGILWYRVHISSDGEVSLVLRQAASSLGIGSADASKPKDYSSFVLGNEAFKTSPQEYAQFDALQAWLKNLSVRMKELPEFALGAQIVERLPGARFSASLGRREGVHLDDGFFIVDLFEDGKGEIQKKTLGYSRIIKTADNTKEEDRNERSLVKAFYGNRIMEGAMLMENPRLGIDLSINIGPRVGMNIPKEASYAPFVGEVFEDDAKSAFEASANFAYNLAPIVGISQLFYDLEVAYGLPIVEYNSDVTGSSAYVLSAYTGISKKAWMGRQGLMFSAKLGYDRFVTTTEFGDYEISIAANALGIKLGIGYQYMLSPNWQFYGGVDYKAGTPPFSSSLIIDDNEYDGGTIDAHDDINLGGAMFKIGFNYSLGQLPINLFGWLDPLKKY